MGLELNTDRSYDDDVFDDPLSTMDFTTARQLRRSPTTTTLKYDDSNYDDVKYDDNVYDDKLVTTARQLRRSPTTTILKYDDSNYDDVKYDDKIYDDKLVTTTSFTTIFWLR